MTAPTSAVQPDALAAAATNERRSRLRTLAVTFLVLLVVCLAIALPDGRATRFDHKGIPADARIAELLPQLGIEDPHHYLRLGHDIAQARGIPSGNADYAVSDRFVLNFWPPGMPLYYAALFSVFGLDMPVGLIAAATMALLWAILLTAYVDLLARRLPWAAVAGMVAIILLSDIMRGWILGTGVFWSEGLHTWSILAALYAAARSATAARRRARLAWAGVIGVALAMGAYIRNVSDLLGWLLVAILVGWAALMLVRVAVQRRRRDRGAHVAPPRPPWHQQLVSLLVCVVAFQAVTVPWRIYAAEELRPGNYAWSTEGNALWHDSWTPDRVLRQRNLDWLLAGAPNTACHVDRSTCEEIASYELRQQYPYSGVGRYTQSEYRRLAIRALARHPVEYMSERVRYLGKAWFWTPFGRRSEWLENTFFAVAFLGALGLSLRRFLRSGPELVAWLFPLVATASMAPFVFIHYEARYFHSVKLAAVVTVFVLLALDPLRARPEPPDTATGSDDASAELSRT